MRLREPIVRLYETEGTHSEIIWDWGSPSHLDEEPGGDQGQAAVLPVEAVVVGIERKVVQVEEPGTQQ